MTKRKQIITLTEANQRLSDRVQELEANVDILNTKLNEHVVAYNNIKKDYADIHDELSKAKEQLKANEEAILEKDKSIIKYHAEAVMLIKKLKIARCKIQTDEFLECDLNFVDKKLTKSELSKLEDVPVKKQRK